ncbi:hypothetical protein JYU34_000571 [Plutella xylostella]|uniref:Uncharacterized protein n=1 Tax=Plutella xylostella TaxID=51655 RepID=A0ABQ7R833_PLUXY|nr:hypothetical protein JYU34_000571 [Plutella xylostella]
MILFKISVLIFILGLTSPAFVISVPVKKDDKLVLSPFELVKLMMQDSRIKRSNLTSDYELKRKDHLRKRPNQYEQEVSSSTEEFCYNLEESPADDEGPLSRRKIWSRWSKWAACSASCGGGAAVRRRRCVAGRCAEGELEEQRRACAMAPCPGATADYD